MGYALTQEGQVTLPKRVRDRLGLEPGARVVFVLNDLGEVVVQRDRKGAPQGARDTRRS